MLKEKLSKLEFTSKVHEYMRNKAIEVGFVFTMIDSSGREWYLSSKELDECTQEAWEECTYESLREWNALKEKFRCEAVDKVSKKYELIINENNCPLEKNWKQWYQSTLQSNKGV